MSVDVTEQAHRYALKLERLKEFGPTVMQCIVELHAPVPWLTAASRHRTCAGCDQGSHPGDAESPEWPCRTAQLILDGSQP